MPQGSTTTIFYDPTNPSIAMAGGGNPYITNNIFVGYAISGFFVLMSLITAAGGTTSSAKDSNLGHDRAVP